METKSTIMEGVREYAEEYPVKLGLEEPSEYNKLKENRITVLASNEGGCNGVGIDLLDLIDWIKKNKPELLR